MFWVLRLPSLPLWILNSFFACVEEGYKPLGLWTVPRKTPFSCIFTPWIFPWWVSLVFTFSLLFHCLGIVTESKNLFCCKSSINSSKSAVGDLLVPLFVNLLGPSRWSKNSLISSKICQVMWAHPFLVNFYFAALIEGWFNTLHNFMIWSYREHPSPNNTHNNAANVVRIFFNSYQFLGGHLGSAFFIYSAPDWVLVPWDSSAASSRLISYSISCVVLGIIINGEIPLSALSYIATGPPRLDLILYISSIYSLTKNTAVSISIPFVLDQYIIHDISYWRLLEHSLDILNPPPIIGMPGYV